MAHRVVLTDGGVYDNLGLEPVWKTHQVVLCSDGGQPFQEQADPPQALPMRLLRVQDIIGNQADAVRKRWLISSYEKKVYQGTYWGIGTEIENYATRGPGYTGVTLDRLRAVRTDFNQFTDDEQLVLMNHGWALADGAVRTHMSDVLPGPLLQGEPPSPELLQDSGRAAEALKDSAKHIRL